MTEESDNPNTSRNEQKEFVDLDHYRKLIKNFCDIRRYQTALFWAEKVCCLTQNDPKDVYNQAHCMFLLKEYHRVIHIIRLYNLEKTHIASYSLLLESLYEAKELEEAVTLIETIDIECLGTSLISASHGGSLENTSFLLGEENNKNELLASIYFIKGKIYEALDNRSFAMDCYVQSLYKSVNMYEALEALMQHEMLMIWEEKELMTQLPWTQQLSEVDTKIIKLLYETKLKKYYKSMNGDQASIKIANWHSLKELTEKIQTTRDSDANIHKSVVNKFLTPTQSQLITSANRMLEDLKVPSFCLQTSLSRASSLINDTQRSHLDNTTRCYSRTKETTDESSNIVYLNVALQRLEKSTDFLIAKAEKLFYDCDYKTSSNILKELLKIDPHHNGVLTLQIGCFIEFGNYNKLFYLAHKLVDRYPDRAISWYAVGCYYDLINKSEPARRFLSKATTLDRLYAPAWLAYGHSFARENEHDQAMAVYFKATQLMRGCHLPLLYIGVECGLTKNLELAEKFFYQAMSVAPLDVYVLHELGVIKYEYEYYKSAEEVFKATADIIGYRAKQNKESVTAGWYPLYNNLGHCCRKNKKYEEALKYHKQALLLKPGTAHIYTAIGFVYALMDDLEEAVTYFHKSLALNRDCIVTSTILKTCIEDLMNRQTTIEEIYSKSSWASSLLCKNSKDINSVLTEEEEDTPVKFTGMKLKFDDEDKSTNSTNCDSNMIMDISMDI